MKKVNSFCWFFLLSYSLILIFMEMFGFTESVANLCGRMNAIVGNAAKAHASTLFGLNGTLVAFFLCLAGVLLIITKLCRQGNGGGLEARFYQIHIVLFFLLGLSERFLGYSQAYDFFSVPAPFLICTLAVVEWFMLMIFQHAGFTPQGQDYVKPVFFTLALMMLLDITDFFVNSFYKINPLFSNLCKTWIAILLFLFSWEILMAKLNLLKNNQHQLTSHIVVKRTLRDQRETEDVVDVLR